MTQPTTKQSWIRSVLLIISLLGLLLTSVFLNRRTTNEIQEASASIYSDRLVPSGIIVSLTSAIYRKRLLLEACVLAVEKPAMNPIRSGLERINRRVDSLLTEFKQTKLTVEEAGQLKLLNRQLTAYNQLEQELLTSPAGTGNRRQEQFTGASRMAFSQVVTVLDELSALQLAVGKGLVGQSRGQTNSIYVITALQIGLVVMIGVSMFWNRWP